MTLYAYFAQMLVTDHADHPDQEVMLNAALFSDGPIGAVVLADAFALLQQAPIPADDVVAQAVLANGNFDVAPFSPIAAQCFVQSINRHIHGAVQLDDRLRDPSLLRLKTSKNGIYLSTLDRWTAITSRYPKCVLHGELTPRFSEQELQDQIELLYCDLSLSRLKNMQRKILYPSFIFEYSQPTEPGIQVVRFLLHALYNTRKRAPDHSIAAQLQFTSVSLVTNGKYLDYRYALHHFGENEAPVFPHICGELNETDTLRGWMQIERFFWSDMQQRVMDKLPHLFPGCVHITQILEHGHENVSQRQLANMCEVYLQVFDSLPVYAHLRTQDTRGWYSFCCAKVIAANNFVEAYDNDPDVIANLPFRYSLAAYQDWRTSIIGRDPAKWVALMLAPDGTIDLAP